MHCCTASGSSTSASGTGRRAIATSDIITAISQASPAAVLNLAGPETLGVRAVAKAFGRHFGVTPEFVGEEAADSLLNDAGKCHRLFGYPSVTPDQMIEWLSRWIGMGAPTHSKPTGFMTRDGRF